MLRVSGAKRVDQVLCKTEWIAGEFLLSVLFAVKNACKPVAPRISPIAQCFMQLRAVAPGAGLGAWCWHRGSRSITSTKKPRQPKHASRAMDMLKCLRLAQFVRITDMLAEAGDAGVKEATAKEQLGGRRRRIDAGEVAPGAPRNQCSVFALLPMKTSPSGKRRRIRQESM